MYLVGTLEPKMEIPIYGEVLMNGIFRDIDRRRNGEDVVLVHLISTRAGTAACDAALLML